MPQLAAALSTTNMDEPPSFFFTSSLSKLLTGDFLVDLINLEEESLPQNQQGIRKYRLKRNKKENSRKTLVAGTAPGISMPRKSCSRG